VNLLRRFFRRKPKKLVREFPLRCFPEGKTYHLQQIFDQINTTYFENKIPPLPITWFGTPKTSAKRHRLLGYYHNEKKFIKIHRLLDQPQFPDYFISYIVYHEMLHYLYPPIHESGRKRRIHHRAFKEQERRFGEYAIAKKWEKEQLWQVIANGQTSSTAKEKRTP